ncbi:hypothetical protein [Tellurirhabdus bombi]|uniref:hypothetical protein n=1 Tax=Tellurirhabdus bombi TaxID=2907205 RepID=UPI001F2EAABA|nr:hypothetical protein [Tellurirhabdus bombi]
MWHFIIKQDALTPGLYQHLQKLAVLTEVELFNEPYENVCLFSVEEYASFVDELDLSGLRYEALTERPTRDELRNLLF